METLQSVVLPSLDVPGDESLYVRANERALCERGRRCVRFAPGGDLWTDTFYGALTVAAWKKASPVKTLILELEGEGEFVASIGVHRLGFALTWLGERTVALEAGVPTRLPVDGWDRIDDGLLFLRLRALGHGELRAARYRTEDPAPNDVRLGLVVTHFNRQAQVVPAIRRIRRQVLQHPDVQGRITLTVVDNSQNLQLADGDGVTRIANRNLGGSGGFARGLLSLADDGRTTHCLFMDDDASCEADAVLRTWALLRYAAQPRLAIAGALLAEAEPWKLLEKGACFDGKCWPLHHGRDVRNVVELMWAERTRERADYGGWWFFAFPIREVKQYPFPFFVRGDDVFFSLANRFDVLTMNGIACLGEEFGVKHGPMTAYLDSRYHLIHAVLREHGRAKMLRRLVNNQFLKPLFAYHYASARGFTLALRHVAEGPKFFRENLDLAAVRGEIGRWQPAEKLQPVDLRGMKLRPARPKTRENPLRQAFRALTLQGFLLPAPLLRKRVLVVDKSFYGRASTVFRFRRVYYQHVQTDTGYLAEHDKRRFCGEIADCARALAHFVRRLPELREQYASEVPQLASEQFWRDVYALPRPPLRAVAGTGDADAERYDERPLSGPAAVAASSPSDRRTPARTG